MVCTQKYSCVVLVVTNNDMSQWGRTKLESHWESTAKRNV